MTGPAVKYNCLVLLILVALLSIYDTLPAQEVGLFRLRRWGGSLRFRWQTENRFAPDLTREKTYNGAFNLHNNGYIINPNLLYFQWSGDVGLYLTRFVTQEINRNTKGRLLSQNFLASLFKSGKYPLTFLWDRNINVIDMEQGGRNNYDINNLQVVVETRDWSTPSRLQIASRDLWEVWDRAGFRTERNQLRRTINYTGRRGADEYNLDLDYDFLNIKDRIRAKWSYSKHTANVRYIRPFGKDDLNQFNSRLSLFIRNGLSDYKNAGINNSIQLHHKYHLSSRYHHSLMITRTLGSTFMQNTAYASASHRLFSSLNTSLSTGGSYSNLRGGNTYTYSLSSSVNYNKKIPLSGRLQLGFTRGYSINNIETNNTEHIIVHERQAFVGGFHVMLNERDIITSSIIVFDEQGKMIFEEGENKDYILTVVGDRVELFRTPFGRIAENAVILVDYRFNTLPTMRYKTNSQVISAGVSFGWLSLTYNINRHIQDLVKGDPAGINKLQDMQAKAALARITLRRDNAGMSVYARHKLYHSRNLDFKSIDTQFSFFVKPFYSLSISNKLSYSLLDHQLELLKVSVYSLRSELGWRPSRSFMLRGYGKYRLRKESAKTDEQNIEYGASLQRYWRVLTLQLRYEKRIWDFFFRTIKEQRFTLEVVRAF